MLSSSYPRNFPFLDFGDIVSESRQRKLLVSSQLNCFRHKNVLHPEDGGEKSSSGTTKTKASRSKANDKKSWMLRRRILSHRPARTPCVCLPESEMTSHVLGIRLDCSLVQSKRIHQPTPQPSCDVHRSVYNTSQRPAKDIPSRARTTMSES